MGSWHIDETWNGIELKSEDDDDDEATDRKYYELQRILEFNPHFTRQFSEDYVKTKARKKEAGEYNLEEHREAINKNINELNAQECGHSRGKKNLK